MAAGERPEELDFAVDLGYMVNTGRHMAIGASLGWRGYQDGGLSAVAVLRRWLPASSSLDLHGGLILTGTNNPVYQLGFPSFAGGVSITWRELLGADLRMERRRVNARREGVAPGYPPVPNLPYWWGWYAGVHSGTRLGPLATGAFAVVTGIIVAVAIAELRD